MTTMNFQQMQSFRDSLLGHDAADHERVENRSAAAILHHPALFASREPTQNHEAPGMFEIARSAIASEWRLSWVGKHFGRSGYEVDPTFRATEEDTWKMITEGLSPDLIGDSFDEAVSLDHAMKIRDQLLATMRSRQTLAEAGWVGITAQIGAMILDPVDIAASAATFGAGGAWAYGTKLTRLQRLMRGGVAAAVPLATLEAYTAGLDPERDMDNVVYAGLGAFVLGGGANVWYGSRLHKAALSWQKQIELSDIQRAGLDLTDDGRAYFRRELTGEPRSDVVRRLVDGIEDMPQATRDALSKMQPDDVLAWVNARSATMQETAREAAGDALQETLGRVPGDLDFSATATPGAESGLLSGLRFDMSGILSRSSVPGVRRLAHLLAENPIPRADGTPTIQSASEWKTRMTRVYMARYQRAASQEFDAWRKAAGRSGPLGSLNDRIEFMEEVGRAMRHDRGTYSASPHVNKLADMQRDIYAELLGVAKRYRVPGFSAVDENDTYIPRIYSTAKIHQAIERFGESNVVALFRDSMLRYSDNLLRDQAQQIATAHVRNIRNLDRTTHLQKARMFDPDQSELLRRVLRDELPDVTDAQIEDIIYATAARPDDAGAPARGKRRLGIDETYAIDLEGVGTLRVDDLLENNAEVLMELYTRQITGHAAMTEVYRGMALNPDDVITSFDALLRRVEAESTAAGVNPKTTARQLKRLETLYRSVVDLPLGGEFGPGFAEWTRHLRSLQFMRVMGQSGFPQAVETAMLLGEVGFRKMVGQLPAVVKLIGNARQGKLTNQSIRQIETIWGFGTDRIRNQVTSRLDAGESLRDFGGGKLDLLMRQGQKFTGDVSLITPISVGQQRMAAGAAMDTWAEIAASGKLPNKMRLASMGLTEDDARSIAAQIRQHSKTYEGVTGVKMNDLNLSAWKDGDAASKLVVAIDKWTRRVIQQNDIGNLAQWMTYDTARIVTQFRIFPAVAWSKHLLHGARMRDWEVASTFMYGMALSGLLYTARTYANSIGRQDREEYLAERLTWDRIAAGAFYHNTYSSLLPMVADTAAYVGDFQQPFQFTRSTGLATNVFFGNPTQDWFDQAMMASRGTANLVRPDKTFTQRDARAISKAMPFQNVLGLSNMINLMVAELPEDQAD